MTCLTIRRRRQSARRRTVCALALFAATVALVGGCSHMIKDRVPYYENDPWQPRPPEGFLYRGTGVWVLEQKQGYTRVLTSDLIHAWVWGDAVVPMEWGAKPDEPENEYKFMEAKPFDPS